MLARPGPLQEPLTPCLVFGVAGRIGSGSSFVQHSLNKIIKTYGYYPEVVDVSKFFLEDEYDKAFGDFKLRRKGRDPTAGFRHRSLCRKLDNTSLLTRIESLQAAGIFPGSVRE